MDPIISAEHAARWHTFEAMLGDPHDGLNPFGFAQAVARDLARSFPEEAVEALVRSGFSKVYWPRALGGQLDDFCDAVMTVRLAARRDLALMPAVLFSITAANIVARAGNDAQRQRVGTWLAEGRTVAFAFTEAASGADPATMSTHFASADNEWRLDGSKWLVGVGALHRLAAVLVVGHAGNGGKNAFHAALIEVDRLTPPYASISPPLPAGAMRGIDFVAIDFTGLPVSAADLVGPPQRGLEAAMIAQQPVRLMSLAGVLGCADTGLRAALCFAEERATARRQLIAEAPIARRLSAAAAHLALADLVTLAASRLLSHFPAGFPVTVAAAKLAACEATERTFDHSATVLGTRAFMACGHFGGMFEKARRDHAIVRVIDSSEHGHRKALSMHLPLLQRAHRGDDLVAWTERNGTALEAAFDLFSPLPAPLLDKLDLVSRGPDQALAAVQAWRTAIVADMPAAFGAMELTREFYAMLDCLLTDPCREGDWDDALRWAWLHAGATALAVWQRNRDKGLFGALPHEPSWLACVLETALAQLRGTAQPDSEASARFLELTRRQLADGWLFSAVPVRLAEAAENPPLGNSDETH